MEWIKTSDGLPGFLEPVLALSIYEGIKIVQREDWETGNDVEGYQSGEYWQNTENEIDYEIEYFTHWMPLPEPPKE